ncbi:hypothetical protein [Allopontixanthobacter sediminis]|uniref:Uncharacterized protein n=1 Tax=Allopontixanthobacter sediminis TaxID=1689985 RepID=A0A845AYN0_9SPHN|nr:hypothetical protein [Allopontixanthobacter sediminis]MXP43036.1 hypothetical protein [Allopontixanthobacter sediminis]
MNKEGGPSGMTVDEWLFRQGLLKQFETVRAARDIGSLRRVFRLIGLPELKIEQLRNS